MYPRIRKKTKDDLALQSSVKAIQSDSPEEKAQGFLDFGDLCLKIGKHKNALASYSSAVKYALKAGKSSIVATAWGKKAEAYRKIANQYYENGRQYNPKVAEKYSKKPMEVLMPSREDKSLCMLPTINPNSRSCDLEAYPLYIKGTINQCHNKINDAARYYYEATKVKISQYILELSREKKNGLQQHSRTHAQYRIKDLKNTKALACIRLRDIYNTRANSCDEKAKASAVIAPELNLTRNLQ